jgi:hypothetical protein
MASATNNQGRSFQLWAEQPDIVSRPRAVKLTDYTAEKVRTLCASPDKLRARWADAGQRADRVKKT